MKKIIYTISLIVAFQFAQGQVQLTSILYSPNSAMEKPLDGGTFPGVEVIGTYGFPIAVILKNNGTQPINVGSVVDFEISFNGGTAEKFYVEVYVKIEVGETKKTWHLFPIREGEMRPGNRANTLCGEAVRVTYSGVSTPITQVPYCASFTFTGIGSNIANIDISKDVSIYPNPVRDHLKIENLHEPTDVTIYNVTGQVICTVTSAMGSTEIDMSNVSAGVYFVKTQNGKDIHTEKIQVVK